MSAERAGVTASLCRLQIELITGTALFGNRMRLESPSQDAAPRYLRGEVILIATGSKPHRPPEIPFDDKFIFDSDSILTMDRIPKSMIVAAVMLRIRFHFTAMNVARSRWWMAEIASCRYGHSSRAPLSMQQSVGRRTESHKPCTRPASA